MGRAAMQWFPGNLGRFPRASHHAYVHQRAVSLQARIAGAVDAAGSTRILAGMKAEFTAIIEEAPEGGYWAICPEVPGANGQGETIDEAKTNLRDAIRLILEDRISDARRGLPEDAIQTVIAV